MLTSLGLFMKSLTIFHEIQPRKIKAQPNVCTQIEQKNLKMMKFPITFVSLPPVSISLNLGLKLRKSLLDIKVI